ncbi:branched-chain amino acid ABC transporter permease [Coralliovum pocilloporae]|uniref:branched-chain amino acid ABC transporter permease n=1 Tax=Coralliovum pocilloporae TaxID=3066369 RepID=UPI0033078AED
MAEFINFYFIPGLVLGSIYALGAIGISMTFGILRFANFAHGEIMTLGVYFAWSLVQLTSLHPLAVLPIAMVLTVAVAIGVDKAFYKPLRNAPVIMLVIASFGLMLMIRSAVQFFWGVQLKSILPGIQFPWWLFDTIRILPKHVLIIGCAVALMFCVHYLLTYTKIGKAMRAMSDSPELARLTGIDTEKVVMATWVVGAGLACAAGVFLAIDTQVETMMGFKLLLPMFAAAILGGIGRPYGAVAGGLIIGLAEELSAYPWITDAPLINPGYKAGVAFVIMVGMLLWRPTGLFKGKVF